MDDTVPIMDTCSRRKRNKSNVECESPVKKLKSQPTTDNMQTPEQNSGRFDITALLNSALSDSLSNDEILLHLNNVGNCSQILEYLNNDTTNSVSCLKLLNSIMIAIQEKHNNFKNIAQNCIQEILSSYMARINKMLSASSTTEQRINVLFLLKTIVTQHTQFAKEILLKVNFYDTNLQLLTQADSKNRPVQTAFIQFILSLLCSGQYSVRSLLLDKKDIIANIISTLFANEAEIICEFLNALKKFVIQNSQLSKTSKMKLFNTQTIKHLVNLYNWRKTEDEAVKKCVHEFLLVLCTSHKYGVVFKDHSMGLSKKQNNLLLSVLNLIEKPWENEYTSNLVLKMCTACPDLTKNVWNNMKSSLEPRHSSNWVNAITFAGILVNSIKPSAIEYCFSELNIYQLSQIIRGLIMPIPILKAIIQVNQPYEHPSIKYYILKFILLVIQMVDKYLTTLKNVLKVNEYMHITAFITNEISNHFPNLEFIIDCETNWTDGELYNEFDYLETAFEIIHYYKLYCPEVCNQKVNNTLDIKSIFLEGRNLCDEHRLLNFHIKVFEYFFWLDASIFLPNTECFSFVSDVFLKSYFRTHNLEIITSVFRKLWYHPNLFYDSEHEVDIWINGLLTLKEYNNDLSEIIMSALKRAYKKQIKLLDAYIKCLNKVPILKIHKQYTDFVIFIYFHLNTKANLSSYLDKQYISNRLLTYITAWISNEVCILEKCNGIFTILSNFSREFLTSNINNFLQDNVTELNSYPSMMLNLMSMTNFYINKLFICKNITNEHITNFVSYLEFLNSNDSLTSLIVHNIFQNELLAKHLKLQNFNYETKLITNILKTFPHLITDGILTSYRQTIYSKVLKMLPNTDQIKCDIFCTILNCVGLNIDQCLSILEKFPYENTDLHSIHPHVIIFCLKSISQCIQSNTDFNKYIQCSIFLKIINYASVLADHQFKDMPLMSAVLLQYLKSDQNLIDLNFDDLVSHLLQFEIYSHDNLLLCGFLLTKYPDLFTIVETYMEQICKTKASALYLLDISVKEQCPKHILIKFSKQLQDDILRILRKPQKANKHYHTYYESIGYLIELDFKSEMYLCFSEKVQKYDVSEVFHFYLLVKIFGMTELNENRVKNMFSILIHLQNSAFKNFNTYNEEKLNKMSTIYNSFLGKIVNEKMTVTNETEALIQYCKFALKYGISHNSILLTNISQTLEIFSISEANAKLLFDMLLSHSDFFTVILGDADDKKIELLLLLLVFCKKWSHFMEYQLVPIILSAYRATMSTSDRIILQILNLFELFADNVQLNEYRPFLWGRTAASFYSIRPDSEKILWRQPKIRDVLNVLEAPLITATIVNYPHFINTQQLDVKHLDDLRKCTYDLSFLLPLFCNLLNHEHFVQTQYFHTSGALSLTILGLCSNDENCRLTSCCILHRYHHHLKRKTFGKDTYIWIRFIEAICRGLSALNNNSKLNTFSSIYLARMAIILSQPYHVMYVPLTRYLSSKSCPNFKAIPELYTFLNHSDVNHTEYCTFILTIIKDGIVQNSDITIFVHCMAFKLISDMCTSIVTSVETKLLILDIFHRCVKIPFGAKLLYNNYSLLVQLAGMFCINSKSLNENDGSVRDKLLLILSDLQISLQNP